MTKEKVLELIEEAKLHHSQYVEEYKKNLNDISQIQQRNIQIEAIVNEIKGRYGLLETLLKEEEPVQAS